MTFLLLLLLAQLPSEPSFGGALGSGPCFLLLPTLSYPMALQPGARVGGAQEDIGAGLGCFSLGWHRVLLETGTSSAGQPRRAVVHKASKGILHLLSRLLRGSHSCAFLQSAAEILVYLDSGVRRGTCSLENRYMP